MSNRQDVIEVVSTWNGDFIKDRAQKLALKSAYEIGLAVQGDAKLLCPVDNGRLIGSITVASGDGRRTKPSGPGANANDIIQAPNNQFEVYVGSSVEYAPYQEYGTMKTSAQPFLRPAFEMAKGKVLKIVQIESKLEFGDYLHSPGKVD